MLLVCTNGLPAEGEVGSEFGAETEGDSESASAAESVCAGEPKDSLARLLRGRDAMMIEVSVERSKRALQQSQEWRGASENLLELNLNTLAPTPPIALFLCRSSAHSFISPLPASLRAWPPHTRLYF
jgi:hypothetical protein